MKGYKNVVQSVAGKLGGYANQIYSNSRHLFRDTQSLGREMISSLSYYRSDSKNTYAARNAGRRRKQDYGVFEIPPDTGYPQLKPVGSYI